MCKKPQDDSLGFWPEQSRQDGVAVYRGEEGYERSRSSHSVVTI